MSDVDEEDSYVGERKVTGEVKKSSYTSLGVAKLGSDEGAALSSSSTMLIGHEDFQLARKFRGLRQDKAVLISKLLTFQKSKADRRLLI